MKNPIQLVIAIMMVAILTGCGAATGEIRKMSRSGRTDVFTEIASEGPAPAGYADVIIKASLKTPLAGYYPFERQGYAPGKALCSFLVNIDGQAILWQVQGHQHQLPKYVDGKTSRDPEAGEGMKYVLEKKVRLAVGSYNVFFSLPDETYHSTTNISVKDGGLYVLEFQPNYRYKTLPTRIPTFLKGVNKFEIMVKE